MGVTQQNQQEPSSNRSAGAAGRSNAGSLNHTGAGADDLAHATKAAGGASGQALVGAAVSSKGGNAGGQPGCCGGLQALQAEHQETTQGLSSVIEVCMQ